MCPFWLPYATLSSNHFHTIGKMLSSCISYKCNKLPPLLSKRHQYLHTWADHTLFWLDHIAAMKITYLPRLLYLCWVLLVHLPTSTLNNIQQQ